jgi:hypothetical protein
MYRILLTQEWKNCNLFPACPQSTVLDANPKSCCLFCTVYTGLSPFSRIRIWLDPFNFYPDQKKTSIVDPYLTYYFLLWKSKGLFELKFMELLTTTTSDCTEIRPQHHRCTGKMNTLTELWNFIIRIWSRSGIRSGKVGSGSVFKWPGSATLPVTRHSTPILAGMVSSKICYAGKYRGAMTTRPRFMRPCKS